MIEKDVEHFGISSELVSGSRELRLDASFYNRRAVEAVMALQQCGMEVRTLGDVAEQVFIPPRFKRIYVKAEHGIPFLQGSHIIQFHPADIKYLSTSAHKRLERWIIRAGWVLVTCSGTVGRVAVAPPTWDGWAASQHVLRIIPREDSNCPVGYLATFLGSPIGQAQLTAQIYGAVVDELTEDQARSVKVPVPTTPAQRQQVEAIDDLAMHSLRQWAEAVRLTSEAEKNLAVLVPPPRPPVSQDVDDEAPFERFRRLTQEVVQVPKEDIAGQ